MKRIVAFLIVITVLFSITTFAESAQNVKAIDDKVKTVIGLGLMSENSEGDLHLEDKLTRAEFSKLLYCVLEYPKTQPPIASNKTYNDVEVWDWYSGYIDYLTKNGIILGTGNGNFSPDMEISFAQVYKMLLKCAGYETFANAKYGVYPQNYMMTANDTGLSKGVSGSFDSSVTRLDVAHILYNLLSIDTISVTSVTEDSIKLGEKEKFSEKIMNLYKTQGIVYATEFLSLNDENKQNGYLMLGKNKYQTKNKDYSDFVGMDVVMYYYDNKATDAKEIVFITGNSNNKVVTLTNRNKISFSNNQYQYEMNGEIQKMSLDKNALVVYNYSMTGKEEFYVPKNGTLKLISNNGDSSADVAIVMDYNTFEIGMIDSGDMKLISKDMKNEIVFSDKSSYNIFTDTNSETDFNSIRVGNIVSVLENTDYKNGYVKAIVSEKTLKGLINEITTENDVTVLIVDDKKYDLLNDKLNVLKYIGQFVTAKLDFNNNVVSIEETNDINTYYRYGYVIKSGFSNGVDKTLQMKILDQDGSIDILVCSDNIKINGSKSTHEQVDKIFNNKRQPIRYRKSEESIKEIQYYNSALKAEENTLILNASGSYYYKPGPKIFKRLWSGSPDGEIIVSDNAVVFDVPAPESPKEYDDENYKIVDANAIASEDETCRVDGFNTNIDKLDQDLVIVYRGGTQSFDKNQPSAIVTAVTQVFDKNLDSSTKKLTTLTGGNTKEYIAYSPEVFTVAGGYDISQGDIIRVLTDKDGYAIKTELLYSKKTNKCLLNTVSPTYGNPDASTNSPCRFVYGYIEKINNGNVIFKFEDNKKPLEYYKIGSAPVYIYDEDSSEKIKKGNTDNIFENEYEENSRVIIHTTRASVVQVFVIN